MPKKVSTKELEALLKLNSAIGLEPIMGLVDKTKAIDEFVAALPQIVKMFTEIKSSLGEEKQMFKEHCAMVVADMKTKAEATVKELKSALNVEREKLDAKTQASLSIIDTRLAEIEDSMETQMREIETRLTPEPEVEEPEEEVTPEEIVGKLQSLTGDSRLDKNAIKGLEEELQRIAAMRSRGTSGGVTTIGVAAAIGNGLRTETPTGDIDGVNVTYTVKNPINAVFSFGINGMVIHSSEYTVTGRTITFATALPSALSGTSFEIKYI